MAFTFTTALRCFSAALMFAAPFSSAHSDPACKATAYLTLDTGSMRDAELIAQVLTKHKVKATFFLANEKTPFGNFALDDAWRTFWQARVAQGHAFGSHTYDHVYFKGEVRGDDGLVLMQARPQFGAKASQTLVWDGAALCQELKRVNSRFTELTGAKLDPVWRAPGGKAPAVTLAAASQCGYRHYYWAPAGFLGDELPSEKYPNQQLLEKALRDIKDGDVLMAHLGIWSRKESFATVFEPLITGLMARGFCFSTVRDHPDFHPRR